MQNKRAIVLVLDSFGIGALPDAYKFGDSGANTLGHIDEYCHKNQLEFKIPNLLKLGLGQIYNQIHKQNLYCDESKSQLIGAYGACIEVSSGKDTTSGHWEIAGAPVTFDWGYFTNKQNSFPPELLDRILIRAKLTGYLGNCHASGTEIITKLGDEHIKSLYPIFYTSADSVFQIACHETIFGLDNLYHLCQIAREELAPYNIARVIARPFNGDNPGNYARTSNRRDYSLKPNAQTLFDVCSQNNIQVISIGKIGDIYAHQNTGIEIKASGLNELCNKTIQAMQQYKDKASFIMTNLVDFDMLYGHRRDVLGYKTALEEFDKLLPQLMDNLTADDILILTADHGCDPTWAGSDHTREYIPFLLYTPKHSNLQDNCLGIRDSFADIGQSISHYLDLPKLNSGISIWEKANTYKPSLTEENPTNIKNEALIS